LASADFGEGEQVVGFVSTLSLPSGHIKNAYREHRTVVLPDFQGLGIGPRISDAVAQIHIDEGKRYYSRTAHPRFGLYRDASPNWKKTCKYRKQRDDAAKKKAKDGGVNTFHAYNFDDSRVCFSHEYAGKRTPDWLTELEEL
jgi:GNAT superfamily N-acetyltransferase